MRKVAYVVYYDSESGEFMEADESAAFKNENWVFRADILLDLVNHFKDEYNENLIEAGTGELIVIDGGRQ